MSAENQYLGPKNADLKDYLHMHLIVVVWGFTSILGLLIKVPTLQLVLMRTAITATTIFLYLKFSGIDYKIPRKVIWQLMGAGVLIACHWLAFFGAARLSNVSTCLAGIATTTFWTSIIEPYVTGRKFRWYESVVGLLVFIGLGIIFYYEFNRLTGLLVAIVSAIFGAFFSVLNAVFIRSHRAPVIAGWEITGSTLFLAIIFPFLQYFGVIDGLVIPTGADWQWLLILALVCTVYPYIASVELMKRFTAFSMNLIINMEPIYGIILARLIFGQSEEMTTQFYMGTLIIMSSVFSFPYLEKYFNQK